MYRTLSLIVSMCVMGTLAAEQSAIDRLMEGNKRFVADELEHPNRNLERRQDLVSGQEPFAVIVGCSDSRVAPEIIFDQGVGDLFVVRVAGNIIGPVELDSIEYSVIYLHSSVIIVLGHENCGAVDAVIKGTTQEIDAVAEYIEPAVEIAKEKDPDDLLVDSIKINALRMRDYLLTTPAVKEHVSAGKLKVYAGYYNLESGEVDLL